MTGNDLAVLGFLIFVVVLLGGVAALIYLGIKKLMANRTSSTSGSEASPSHRPPLKESLTVRSIVIGVLALLMLIPLAMVGDMVRERHRLYNSVLTDIAGIWGTQQTFKGPILVVPYTEKTLVQETVKDEKTGEETTTSQAVFQNFSAVVLPKGLSIEVELQEQLRHRGIYKSLVYAAELQVQGHFEPPDLSSISENLHRTDWDKAYLVVSISDTRAINEVSALTWNGQPQSLAPGTRLTDLLGSGFHAPVKMLPPDGAPYNFHLSLSVNGSQGFRFAPFGEDTQVQMTSSWPHPSFQGSALPAHYETHEAGFEATWSIPHLARNYPQLFAYPKRTFELDEFLAGVDLFEPVFLYSKVTRAVKYGLLFVGLTFLVFLIFELVYSLRLHFVQYGLIGIALTLFYLTLLSFAEHINFFRAYVLASAVSIGMITCYTGAVIRSWQRTAVVAALLTTLYTLLFSLLQLEDYALLMGTVLLLIIVAVLMILTRNLRSDA